MWILYTIIAVALVLDRLTKIAVITNMALYQSIPVIKDIFNFTYVRNTGAAFSIFSNSNLLLGIFTAVVVIAGLVYIHYKKFNNKYFLLYCGMIIGGAVGNLIDRFYYQYVIDFIDVQFMEFAVFNVADCFIVVGCILLAGWIILTDSKKGEVNRSDRD